MATKTPSDKPLPLIVVGQPTNRGGGETRKLGAICFLNFVLIETMCS